MVLTVDWTAINMVQDSKVKLVVGCRAYFSSGLARAEQRPTETGLSSTVRTHTTTQQLQRTHETTLTSIDPNHKRLFRSLVLVHNFDCYLLHRVLVPQPAARDSSNKSTANHFPHCFPSSPIHVSESRRLFPIKYLGHTRLPIFVFFF